MFFFGSNRYFLKIKELNLRSKTKKPIPRSKIDKTNYIKTHISERTLNKELEQQRRTQLTVFFRITRWFWVKANNLSWLETLTCDISFVLRVTRTSDF